MSRLGLQAALAGIGLVAALGCGNHDDSGPAGAAGQVGAGSAGREDRGAGGEAGKAAYPTGGRDSTSQVGGRGSEDGGSGARAEGGALPGHDGVAGDGIQATGGGSSGGSGQAGDASYGGSAGDAGDRGGNHSGGNGTTGGSSSAGTSHSGGGNATGATGGSPSGGSGGSGGASSGGSGGSTSGGSAGTGGSGGIGPSVTVMQLNTLGTSGWGAWQDGDGHWQQFSTAAAEYTFTPTSSRYGVATVGCWGMARSVNVQYRTTAVTVVNACDRVPQPEPPRGGTCAANTQFSGTLTNTGTSGWLDVEGSCPRVGFGKRVIAPVGGSTTYDVTSSLPTDLFFAIASAQGEPFTRIAVKRAVDTSTLDIDFDVDGAPATTRAFAITGQGESDTQSHSMLWHTSGSAGLYFEAATNPESADDTYSAIDPSLVQAGDSYVFSAQACEGGECEDSQVKTELWGEFATPTDISFPVSYVSASASVAASVPYGRVQVDLLAFPGAQHYAMEATGQVVSGSPTVRWWVDATPDWFTGVAPYRLAMPNLDSASGWDNSRGFTPGSRATIVAYASIQSPLSDGSQTIVGKRTDLSAIP